jgi:hypothetical protein
MVDSNNAEVRGAGAGLIPERRRYRLMSGVTSLWNFAPTALLRRAAISIVTLRVPRSRHSRRMRRCRPFMNVLLAHTRSLARFFEVRANSCSSSDMITCAGLLGIYREIPICGLNLGGGYIRHAQTNRLSKRFVRCASSVPVPTLARAAGCPAVNPAENVSVFGSDGEMRKSWPLRRDPAARSYFGRKSVLRRPIRPPCPSWAFPWRSLPLAAPTQR